MRGGTGLLSQNHHRRHITNTTGYRWSSSARGCRTNGQKAKPALGSRRSYNSLNGTSYVTSELLVTCFHSFHSLGKGWSSCARPGLLWKTQWSPHSTQARHIDHGSTNSRRCHWDESSFGFLGFLYDLSRIN